MKKLLFPLLTLFTLNIFAQSNIEIGETAPEIHITDWIANTPADKDLTNKFVVLEFSAAPLSKIFAEILNLEPGNIIVPESLEDERYFLMYKNAAPESDNLSKLEEEILNILQLEKSIVEKSTTINRVTVQNESLLEEALETRFSSRSDAGEKIIFSGYTISDLLAELNEISKVVFIADLNSDVKYDFIINKNSADETIKSLESYGLKVEEDQQIIEQIKLEVKN